MNISPAGLALTKSFEGCRLTAYQDVAGIWTIGYGSTVPPVKPGEAITELEAEQRLLANMQTAVNCVNSVTKGLAQYQFDACCDFAYNVGCGAFKGSTLLLKIDHGDFIGAAAQFGNWIHADGEVVPGLVRRRAAEALMFSGPEEA
jgi:lysozyme